MQMVEGNWGAHAGKCGNGLCCAVGAIHSGNNNAIGQRAHKELVSKPPSQTQGEGTRAGPRALLQQQLLLLVVEVSCVSV